MLDGFLARRWKVESLFGARSDSMADFLFVLTVGYKLFPCLRHLPLSIWIAMSLIILIRISNAIVSLHLTHKIHFLHTKANKVTGILLWVGTFAINQPYFPLAAWGITIVALFAAIQENILILRMAQEDFQ